MEKILTKTLVLVLEKITVIPVEITESSSVGTLKDFL